jgi:hypothetical protein
MFSDIFQPTTSRDSFKLALATCLAVLYAVAPEEVLTRTYGALRKQRLGAVSWPGSNGSWHLNYSR